MTEVGTIIATIIFFAFIIFGTHFIRTVAFNRHEAITFECSSIAALIMLLYIWEYGITPFRIAILAGLLVMFIANALIQWHFYMELQDIILNSFETRENYLLDKKVKKSIIENIKTMASVAIMPSFSRFIEESRLFNNDGGFIGLVKMIMKRERFQKKKYLMRESFADNFNLIGPCKPKIDDMMLDEEHVIPSAIHANDLALGKKSEIKGLLSYDILGFGAVAILLVFIFSNGFSNPELHPTSLPWGAYLAFMCLSVVALTLLGHGLRHYGFARYESPCYEFSFSALVIVTFRGYDTLIKDGTLSIQKIIIMVIYFLAFVFLSFLNKHLDKKLHKRINNVFETIIRKIPPETETERIKRKFLFNLEFISEWSLVPYIGEKRESNEDEDLFKELSHKENRSFSESRQLFKMINHRKQDMPRLTKEMLHEVAPGIEEDKYKEEDFRLSKKDSTWSDLFRRVVSIGSFAAVFVLIWAGLI